ncbi:MAG: hypothetical protein WCJ30_18835 [Deltaproteobacteria bacterium]
MSTAYHPHLFDAERFDRERGAGPAGDVFFVLIDACIPQEDPLCRGLERGDVAGDFVSARLDSGGSVLGSIVDAIASGLPVTPDCDEARALLAHLSAHTGRFVSLPPLVGYVTLGEIERLQALLAPLTLDGDSAERDRQVLLQMLGVAATRGLGVVYITA